jgi:hypothetical protein
MAAMGASVDGATSWPIIRVESESQQRPIKPSRSAEIMIPPNGG